MPVAGVLPNIEVLSCILLSRCIKARSDKEHTKRYELNDMVEGVVIEVLRMQRYAADLHIGAYKRQHDCGSAAQRCYPSCDEVFSSENHQQEERR